MNSSWSLLELDRVRGRSSPVTSRSSTGMKLLHPRVDDWCHTIVATYGGGLVDGDAPGLRLRCGEGCRLYLTSPSFTQVFQGQAQLRLEGRLEGDAVALFHGLPLVPHAASGLSQRSRWSLGPGSTLVVVDWLVSGRTARGESYLYSEVDLELRIERDGQTLLLDRLRSRPDVEGVFLPSLFGGYGASLIVTLVGPAIGSVASRLARRWNTEVGPRRAVEPPQRLVNLTPLPRGHGYQLRAVAVERRFLDEVERSLFDLLQDEGVLTFDPLSHRP